jgi:hypothetical protein
LNILGIFNVVETRQFPAQGVTAVLVITFLFRRSEAGAQTPTENASTRIKFWAA